MAQPSFTIGVEEEFQIVDPDTRELKSSAKTVVPSAQHLLGEAATNEFLLSQIETGTPVCDELAQVRQEIKRLRRGVIEAAESNGAAIVAASTHPFSRWEDQRVTPKERYRELAEDFGQIVDELLIWGCHVHIGIGDRELSIALMNRTRAWMPLLLALTANSPFWEGGDTSYASYRLEVWRRFPHAGSPLPFANRAEYDSLVRTLVNTGAISDETKIYWDIRPADRFETLEFRIADVPTEIETTILHAALCRAIAQTAYADELRDRERAAVFMPARDELMRAANWRAARYGLSDRLIDVPRGELVPAHELVARLLEWIRPALEENREWDEVSARVETILREGNGAMKQRAIWEETGDFKAVVDDLIARTKYGIH